MKIETMLGRRNTISSSSSGKFWPFSFKSSSFGSTVAIQKLRETKWFGEDEERIFCSVVESGFIVEVHDENRENNWFGIVDFSVKKGTQQINISAMTNVCALFLYGKLLKVKMNWYKYLYRNTT